MHSIQVLLESTLIFWRKLCFYFGRLYLWFYTLSLFGRTYFRELSVIPSLLLLWRSYLQSTNSICLSIQASQMCWLQESVVILSLLTKHQSHFQLLLVIFPVCHSVCFLPAVSVGWFRLVPDVKVPIWLGHDHNHGSHS